MDTASAEFVAFGLTVALLSNLSRSRLWRTFVVLLASLSFIGILAQQFTVLVPLACFLLMGYMALRLIQHGWANVQVWSIWAVLLTYIWLKRYTFLPHGIFLRFPYFTLGLSYIFFRVMSLLIEAGKREGTQRVGVLGYLTYTLNFTTFVSGPIQGYDQFAEDQFADQPVGLGPQVICSQLERIVRGFFKVNVVALVLQLVQADALAQMSQAWSTPWKMFAALKLAVVYPLFLYANFSGYIDIVIALARLMRLRLPENFDRPLSASSFLDFWNRWHITLSHWFKTFVYNPLLVALMRRFESPAVEPWLGVVCFFLTFFLVGVWHGRTSVFLVYGLLQGAGVSINKLWQLSLTRRMGRKRYKALASNPVYTAFGRGLTFSWFAFTLFWFWTDWVTIHRIFAALSVVEWLGVWAAVCFSSGALLTLWEMLRNALLAVRTSHGPVVTSRYARMIYASALGTIAIVFNVLLNQPAPDIVYKAF